MKRAQYLLGKLAEEAAEVSQIALKTQQFGLDEIRVGQPFTNAERIKQELNDLNAIIKMLNDEFDFDYAPDENAIVEKIVKVGKYYALSRWLNQVET